jgi:hypothetical protein
MPSKPKKIQNFQKKRYEPNRAAACMMIEYELSDSVGEAEYAQETKRSGSNEIEKLTE